MVCWFRAGLLLTLFVGHSLSSGSHNNSVTFGNIRVTIHAPALLRLEWSAKGLFDDRPTLAFTNRAVGPAAFSVTTNETTLNLNTSQLLLTYEGSDKFSGSNLQITFELKQGVRSIWTPTGPGTVPCGTVAGQDRQDCGIELPNATSCAAAGCCFDPNVNGTNYDQHVTHCCALGWEEYSRARTHTYDHLHASRRPPDGWGHG
jgi:hypothetical protein